MLHDPHNKKITQSLVDLPPLGVVGRRVPLQPFPHHSTQAVWAFEREAGYPTSLPERVGSTPHWCEVVRVVCGWREGRRCGRVAVGAGPGRTDR